MRLQCGTGLQERTLLLLVVVQEDFQNSVVNVTQTTSKFLLDSV
jgi:hypothetical protein